MGKMLSTNLKQLFPEGTDEAAGLKTAALPVIWQNWAGFEQAAMRFQEETAKLAEVAQGGDMAAIGQQLGSLGKNGCGGCHATSARSRKPERLHAARRRRHVAGGGPAAR